MLSIRTNIRFIIALMGLLGVALVLVSVNWYQELVFSEQRQSMSVLTSHIIEEQLEHHESYLIDMAQTLQSTPDFRQALGNRDHDVLRFLINDQFYQYFTTTGLLDLKKVIVYDTEFNTVIESDIYTALQDGEGACDKLVARARSRQGAERLKSLSATCRFKDYAHHMAIVPIGGLKITGYLAAIADPVNTIKSADHSINLPFKISLANGKVIHYSATWPDNEISENMLLATHKVMSDEGEELFDVTVMNNVAKLNDHLKNITQGITAIAIAITLTAILFTMAILKSTITSPLSNLINHMRRVRSNKDVLEEKIEEFACKELNELSREFNEMTSKLHSLQKTLVERAHTDELTGLPNRTLFYDRLAQLLELSRRQKNKFTLFMIDLDKFKQVNDTMGHHAGDELLKQIGHRFQQRVRSTDTVARFGGDEFALLLPEIESEEAAFSFAKDLSIIVGKPYIIEDREVEIGLSIGIAIYPDTAEDAGMLFRCADKGMYYAKTNKLGHFICDRNCPPGGKCSMMDGTE